MDIALEREVLVTLLNDEEKLTEVLPVLKPAHISAPHLRWMLKKLFIYHAKYASLPPLHYFQTQLKKDKFLDTDDKERYERLITKLYKKKTIAGLKKYAVEELRDFINKREIARIIEESIDHLEKDDVDETLGSLAAATKVKIYQKEYQISDWLTGWETRQADRKQRKESPEKSKAINFPWRTLNKIIGGIQPGECGCIASLTGLGKSISLVWCGRRAFIDGKKVVHFVTENSLWQTEQRYDAAMLGVEYNKLKYYKFSTKERKKIDTLVESVRKHIGENLRIIKLQPKRATIVTIERVLSELDATGFRPDYIIVDSADHLRAVDGHKEVRHDQANVYWDIKTLADVHELPCMTSTQVRQAERFRKASAEALAEAYDKARILDIVLTMNQMAEGSVELIMNVAKNRDGRSGFEIPLIADYSTMRIQEKR